MLPTSSMRRPLGRQACSSRSIRTLEQQFPSTEHSAPDPAVFLTGSQANYQLLNNGGPLIGWGSVSTVSETNAAGGHVFAESGSYVYNYRAHTYNWTGRHLDNPALALPVQLENATTPLIVYFSWNGTTEVVKWRLWGSVNNETGSEELNTVKKQGFETRRASADYTPLLSVEALTGREESLGKSSIVGVGRLLENGTEVMPTTVPTNEATTPSATANASSLPTVSSDTGSGAAMAVQDVRCALYLASALRVMTVLFAMF